MAHEREWREASDMRPSTLWLLTVVIVAALLRFWAVGAGIPPAADTAEARIVRHAVAGMQTGEFHPRSFEAPGFYTHVQTDVAIVRFVTGAWRGEWSALDEAPEAAFYRWGRTVTALLGVFTVLVVFNAGMRWGARHALLAAGLMTVMPAHVGHAQVVGTEVPLTFFVALTLLLSLRAHERGTAAAFAWAGAAAGLAAATQYAGVFALLLPLVCCWMTVPVRPSRTAGALALVGAALVAFLLAAPFTIRDLPGFLDGLAATAAAYRALPQPDGAGWILTLDELRLTFGWPALLLAIGGLIMGLVRFLKGPGRVRWALVTTFTLAYFAFVASRRDIGAAVILPMLPALCLLAANAVVSGVSLLRRYELPRAPRTALIVALTVAALLPPSVMSVMTVRQLSERQPQSSFERQPLPRTHGGHGG